MDKIADIISKIIFLAFLIWTGLIFLTAIQYWKRYIKEPEIVIQRTIEYVETECPVCHLIDVVALPEDYQLEE